MYIVIEDLRGKASDAEQLVSYCDTREQAEAVAADMLDNDLTPLVLPAFSHAGHYPPPAVKDASHAHNTL